MMAEKSTVDVYKGKLFSDWEEGINKTTKPIIAAVNGFALGKSKCLLLFVLFYPSILLIWIIFSFFFFLLQCISHISFSPLTLFISLRVV